MDVKSLGYMKPQVPKEQKLEGHDKNKDKNKVSKDKSKAELPPAVAFEKSENPEKVTSDYSKIAKEAQAMTEADKLKLLVDQKMEGAFYLMVKDVLDGQNIGMKQAIEKILEERKDEITPEMIEEAQADVAEGGFYSVEKVTERLIDFAKALSGDDPSKAGLFKDAFEKGFEEATAMWGDELPQISQDTYDSVMKAFDEWEKSGENTDEVAEEEQVEITEQNDIETEEKSSVDD